MDMSVSSLTIMVAGHKCTTNRNYICSPFSMRILKKIFHRFIINNLKMLFNKPSDL